MVVERVYRRYSDPGMYEWVIDEFVKDHNIMDNILKYAKGNLNSFECGSISSNEICFLEYKGKRYVLKMPLMVGEKLSPFWRMMKNIFDFTFRKQYAKFENVYNILKDNPHIPTAPFVAADDEMMIFEFMDGVSWSEDCFPTGRNNAYILGQYIGYNHCESHKCCGLLGVEDIDDFFERVHTHIQNCINTYWNGEEHIDKRVRAFYDKLKCKDFQSSRYSMIMVDICADQFLYNGEEIAACVDLDSYVIGPVEWELSMLKNQVSDWDSFKACYETYLKMPDFEPLSDLFHFLMGLNSYNNKFEMEHYWSRFFTESF